MLSEIIYELPKSIELSEDLRERAIAYMKLKSFGRTLYVPITAELKALLHLPVKDGKLVADWETTNRLERVLLDILRGAELQLRDEVGAEIEATLLGEVTDSFERLFAKPIKALVKEKLNQKLLAGPGAQAGVDQFEPERMKEIHKIHEGF